MKFLRDRITKELITDMSRDDSDEAMSVRFATTTSSLELNYQNHANVGECDSLIDEASFFLDTQNVDLGYPDGCLDSGSNLLATQPDNDDVLWLWLSANNCYISDEARIKHWFSVKTGMCVCCIYIYIYIYIYKGIYIHDVSKSCLILTKQLLPD